MTTKPLTINFSDIERFKALCAARGLPVRLSTAMGSINKADFEVHFQGHWMGVRENESTGRLTVDKRLASVVEHYKAEVKHERGDQR